MSDLTSAAPPEVQAKAEAMGWIPPTRYNKAPDRFVDAEEFIKRGEIVIPIIRETNKRLTAEVAAAQAQTAAIQAALAQTQKSVAEMEERHAVELQKTRERTREQIKAQLAAASSEDDHEAVAELTDRLVKISAEPPPKEAPKVVPAAPPTQIDPALREWNVENPWFGKDKRRTALALSIAQEFREGGDPSIGRAFYEKVAAEVSAVFDKDEGTPASKVEGARNGTEGPRTGSKRSYDTLPAEARSACDADQRNFVGPTKRYKTAAEWRNRYAEIYYQGE